MALIHFYGKEGVPKSLEKSVYLYKKAVALGDDRSMNNLALLYHYGETNFPKNIKKAISLYNKAIELGNVNAMYQ